MKKIALFFCLIITSAYSQLSGCTDSLSKNHNPNATVNDGNCTYKTTKIKPNYSITLSDTLHETSGLIAFNKLLWTHNDDHDTTLYGIDSLGIIQKKVNLLPLTNHDWESITQDSTHIFIGDFGNNYTGNRTDLKIFRIEKKSFYSQNPAIDTISFSYSDQKNFASQPQNTTNYDCEAFIILNDTIYLFTKEWSNHKTSIYVLPKTPGKYSAQYKETINTDGLITDAAFVKDKNTIVLSGYSASLHPFLFLLYDYKNETFSTGNKRKINLKLPFHQIEGITTINGTTFYITNEATLKRPIIHTNQKLHQFNLGDFLKK